MILKECEESKTIWGRKDIARAIKCPFKPLYNKNLVEVTRHTAAWVKRFYGENKATQKIIDAGMVSMAAGFYPYASFEQLCLAADYLYWVFTLDDMVDESTIGKQLDLLTFLFRLYDTVFQGNIGDEGRKNTSVVALHNIVERLKKFVTPKQLLMFREQNYTYFGGMLWEANNRNIQWVPDTATYFKLRPAAGAVPPFLGLMIPLNNLELPTNLITSHLFERFCNLAGRIVCWINDVLSYEKEQMHGDIHNLVCVYEYHQGAEPQTALRMAINTCNREIQVFCSLASQFSNTNNEEDRQIKNYIRLLESFMATTLDWTLNSMRYEE